MSPADLHHVCCATLFYTYSQTDFVLSTAAGSAGAESKQQQHAHLSNWFTSCDDHQEQEQEQDQVNEIVELSAHVDDDAELGAGGGAGGGGKVVSTSDKSKKKARFVERSSSSNTSSVPKLNFEDIALDDDEALRGVGTQQVLRLARALGGVGCG